MIFQLKTADMLPIFWKICLVANQPLIIFWNFCHDFNLDFIRFHPRLRFIKVLCISLPSLLNMTPQPDVETMVFVQNGCNL